MEFLHAIIVLSNFVIIPAIAYGSQLALGALGVTLVYGILTYWQRIWSVEFLGFLILRMATQWLLVPW